MASKDLVELTDVLGKQNTLLESLEKELTDLCVKNKTNQDPNAQLVRQFTTENEQLKAEIASLKASLNSLGPVTTPSTCNLSFEEKYELISRNLQEIVGADR